MNEIQTLPRFVEIALPIPLARTFTYRWPEAADRAPVVGDAVEVKFRGRRQIGTVAALSSSTELEKVLELESVFDPVYRIEEERRELARQVADYYGARAGEVLRLMLPPRPGTTARRSPLEIGADREPRPGHELTDAQAVCIERIGRALDEPRYESFLLHGVTGSGKTEVYLQLIARCLERGQNALVLLPEISLTPQTIRRVRERFPGQVAPSHSRL